MKCKTCEKLLLDELYGEISNKEILEKDLHLRQCQKCQAFNQDMQIMQSAVSTELVILPNNLDQITKRKCLQTIEFHPHTKPQRSSPKNWQTVPVSIWAALGLITMFTLILVIPSFSDPGQQKSLSSGVIASLILLAQNAVMLIISPVLIFRFAKKSRRMVMKNG